MAWLIQILGVILRVLLPALLERREETSEDGMRRPELRGRLRDRVRQTWARSAAILVLALSLLVFTGCGRGTQTIYVPPGEPVRLRETIRNAKVWVADKDGKPVAGRMDLPAGWYCLPVPEPEPD